MTFANESRRFWSFVYKDGPLPELRPDLGPCWLWTGQSRKSRTEAYGGFCLDGRTQPAHRIAYLLTRGALRPGLVIDHLCSRPLCVRPSHLEEITQRENVLRGRNHVAALAARTHCRNGHPFDPANTYLSPTGRVCRICQRAKQKAFEKRRQERRLQVV